MRYNSTQNLVFATTLLTIGLGLLALSFWQAHTSLMLLSGGLLSLGLSLGMHWETWRASRSNRNKSSSGPTSLEQCQEKLSDVQEKLIIQEKLASVGLLTAGIAHEVKNPLNFVNNFANLTISLAEELTTEFKGLKEKIDLADQENIQDILTDISSNCEKIQEHGKRAESVVKSMLLQSRDAEEIQLEAVDINQVLIEYLNLAYHGMRAQNTEFNIKINKKLSQDLGLTYVFPQAIGRVFLNLFNNSMYATAEKAEKNKNDNYAPVITVTTEKNEKFTIITIKDNGPGISEDQQNKIFQPFYTTKPATQGTGLGLSICYDIITQQQKGEILLDSKLGEYTVFTIKLPNSKPEED
jgi:signal transduction histidine kinase